MIPSEPVPGPAYRIVTPRLVIRCLEPKDASMHGVAIEESLDHLLPWMAWAKQWPLSIQERIELLRKWRGNFDLGVDFEYGNFNPAESFLLGAAGLHTRHGQGVREIGYWIHKDHINHGYATETSAALTKVAFEIDHVTRVEIHCEPSNIRSASVPRKLGFTHDPTLQNRIEYRPGNLRDSIIWTPFTENYATSLAVKADIQAFDAIGIRII